MEAVNRASFTSRGGPFRTHYPRWGGRGGTLKLARGAQQAMSETLLRKDMADTMWWERQRSAIGIGTEMTGGR